MNFVRCRHNPYKLNGLLFEIKTMHHYENEGINAWMI